MLGPKATRRRSPHPRGDRARGRVAGDRRRPRRAVDRQPRPRPRHEQERHLRPLRLEAGSAAGDRRRSTDGSSTPRSSTPRSPRQPGSLSSSRCATRSSTTSHGGRSPAVASSPVPSLEMGTRPGPVKDQIAAFQDGFTALIRQFVVTALEQHELPPTRTPTRSRSSSTASSSPPTPTSRDAHRASRCREIRPWQPSVPSTTWVTPKSAATDASE